MKDRSPSTLFPSCCWPGSYRIHSLDIQTRKPVFCQNRHPDLARLGDEAPVVRATRLAAKRSEVHAYFQPRLSDRLSHVVRVSDHTLLSGARSTRDEHARSQPERQSDRHHDEGARERGLRGHQEDDAQQQGGHRLQRGHKGGLGGAPLRRLGQRAVWCLSCQPIDGAPAWLDEHPTEGGYEDQADQRDGNPACLQAPGGKRHREPGGEPGATPLA
jgi:hypothetical protein